ncbi:MAG: hypothetical protein AAB618_00325 [Patescibacteria group bacterium]
MDDRKYLEEAITAAQNAAGVASPELKEKAFEVVLEHLLKAQSSTSSSGVAVGGLSKVESLPGSALDSGRLATQLGISVEQVNELYEMKGDELHVAIKPVGRGVADQQRNLAYALIAGYKFGLDIKEVPITVFTVAADEWGIRDSNLGRNLKEAKGIQAKGVGKGKKPVFSLAPGGIDKIRDEIVALFG